MIRRVCGGPLCPVLLEVMLCRPTLVQEDARARSTRGSERFLFSTWLLPPAWARWRQRDAEPGTSERRCLSSSCNQSVLQIRKLHINAFGFIPAHRLPALLAYYLNSSERYPLPPLPLPLTLFFRAAVLPVVGNQLRRRLQPHRLTFSTLITACLGKEAKKNPQAELSFE